MGIWALDSHCDTVILVDSGVSCSLGVSPRGKAERFLK